MTTADFHLNSVRRIEHMACDERLRTLAPDCISLVNPGLPTLIKNTERNHNIGAFLHQLMELRRHAIIGQGNGAREPPTAPTH